MDVKANLNAYCEDLKHFIETGEFWYTEEEDDEEYGIYVNTIQYKFIQAIHEVKFDEAYNGISLSFNFKDDSDEYNLKENIRKTLENIKTIAYE